MIFVVGYSRSGTKMMNLVLSQLGIADTVPEIHFFEQVVNIRGGDTRLQERLNSREASAVVTKMARILRRAGLRLDNGKPVQDIVDRLQALASGTTGVTQLGLYRELVAQLSRGAAVDSTPRNAYYMMEIAELIPEARFIYMVRDPRDCILSQRQKWRSYWNEKGRPGEAVRLLLNYNPILMGLFWRNSLRACRSAMEWPERARIKTFQYEKIVEDPESVARDVCAFLGVADRELDTSFIHRNNSRKWVRDLPETDAYLVQLAAGRALTESGYEAMEPGLLTRLMSVPYALYYIVKLLPAFVANLARTSNPWRVIRRRLMTTR